MNRNLSERQCMERHYLQLEPHVQRSGGKKKRVELDIPRGFSFIMRVMGSLQRFLSRRET